MGMLPLSQVSPEPDHLLPGDVVASATEEGRTSATCQVPRHGVPVQTSPSCPPYSPENILSVSEGRTLQGLPTSQPAWQKNGYANEELKWQTVAAAGQHQLQQRQPWVPPTICASPFQMAPQVDSNHEGKWHGCLSGSRFHTHTSILVPGHGASSAITVPPRHRVQVSKWMCCTLSMGGKGRRGHHTDHAKPDPVEKGIAIMKAEGSQHFLRAQPIPSVSFSPSLPPGCSHLQEGDGHGVRGGGTVEGLASSHGGKACLQIPQCIGGMAAGTSGGRDGHPQPNWIMAEKALLYRLMVQHVLPSPLPGAAPSPSRNCDVQRGGGAFHSK